MKDSELLKHMQPSLYRILCVERRATQEQIRQNWKGLQKTFHPDKNTGNEVAAHEKSIEINFAYKILSDPKSKAKYDALYDKFLKDQLAQQRKKSEPTKPKKSLPKIPKETFSSDMRTYVIIVSLNPTGTYNELHRNVQTFSTWWRNFNTMWIVRTHLTAVEIRNILGNYLGKEDQIFVGCLRGDTAWQGINQERTDWLLNYLF